MTKKLFISLLIFCLSYRVLFLIETYHQAIDPVITQLTMLGLGLLFDITACAFATGLFAIINHKSKVLFFIIYIFFALIYFINLKIYSLLFIGINYTLVLSYFNQGLSSLELLLFTNSQDIVLVMLIAGIIAIPVNKSITIVITSIYIVCLVSASAIFINSPMAALNQRQIAMFNSPAIQLIASNFYSHNQFDKKIISLGKTQSSIIAPMEFINIKNNKSQQLNIVIFVLESTSSRYIFDKINNQSVAMPFLKSLMPQGLWFENHYASGNISALGQFSILTGLYPNPTPTHFEMQNNTPIPTLSTWLGKRYTSLLVTASNNLYNSRNIQQTFSKYYNADSIQNINQPLFFNMFADENQTFNFFTNHLNRINQPFLAVYLSGATHYPYKNYANSSLNPYLRYLNNLKLLDNEIKQTVDLLKKRNLLKNTILIVVGDHGELFGQHHGLLAHGQTLFQEEIHVPLLIYSPALLKPKIIHEASSHVDILPTIFDVLNIPYEGQLQGKSFLLPAHTRKYIFSYSDHDDISAINMAQIKMIVSFSEDTCSIFNLIDDPHEMKPLACHDDNQLQAILQFRRDQPIILNGYHHTHKKA